MGWFGVDGRVNSGVEELTGLEVRLAVWAFEANANKIFHLLLLHLLPLLTIEYWCPQLFGIRTPFLQLSSARQKNPRCWFPDLMGFNAAPSSPSMPFTVLISHRLTGCLLQSSPINRWHDLKFNFPMWLVLLVGRLVNFDIVFISKKWHVDDNATSDLRICGCFGRFRDW